MKRLALVVAVASFSAVAGEPTQPPTTTAPVAKKKSLSTAEVKTVFGSGSLGSGSVGSGSLGTRGSGTSTKTTTPTPTK